VISPDERLVAVNGRDQVIRLWGVAGAKPGPQIPYDGYVSKMRFDAAGERLLTIRTDGIARIWDVATGQARTPPFGFEGTNIQQSAFCGRDSAFIATTDGEGTLRLWDAAMGDPITPELEHFSSARFEAFDADAHKLTTSTRLGIFDWDLAPARESIEWLEQLAQVSSGRRIDPTGGESAVSLAALGEAWKALRSAPELDPPGLSAATLESWHWSRWQWSLGFSDQNPLSVVFHLSRLIDSSPKRASLHQSRGQALFRLARYDDALADFREELAIQRASPGHDRYDEAVTLHWIGNTESQKGRMEEADRADREALSILRDVTGEDSLDVSRVRAALGMIAGKRNDFAEAVAQLGPALKTVSASRAFSLVDEDRAGLTFTLAVDYFRMGQPERTESVLLEYEKELRTWPDREGRDDWKQKWTRSMVELTNFYRAWNKPEKARPFDEKLKENAVASSSTGRPTSSHPTVPGQTVRPDGASKSIERPAPGTAAGRDDPRDIKPVQEPKPQDTRSARIRRLDAIGMLHRLGAKYELNYHGDITSVASSGARLTDDDLALLTGMPTLESLSLAKETSKPVEHRITDRGLAALRDMPALRTLYLTDCPFSDAALPYIGGMKQLSTLGLGGTKVTDAGLVHLKNLNKLAFLSLSNTETSDQGIAVLLDLKGLRQLLLGGTRVTKLGVLGLKQELPNCQVKW
jgi:tetratricopeptide (TPR) repeat protein